MDIQEKKEKGFTYEQLLKIEKDMDHYFEEVEKFGEEEAKKRNPNIPHWPVINTGCFCDDED